MDFGTFVPGGTQFCIAAWLKLTHDPFVINNVKGVQIDLNEIPQQAKAPEDFHMSIKNRDLLNNVVREHLAKGIVEVATPTRGQYISNVFLRPKPNGKHRLILDLSVLNESIVYRHFKMENLKTAIDLIQRGCFLASLDLSDAYYSINIAKQDRKLLRFKWGGVLYEFTCLPNGLAQAPRTFTKILKPVFASLQELGHTCFGYIDDTFIMGETFEQCRNTVVLLKQQLIDLGFKIHEKKSILEPTNELTFLGYVINTLTMEVKPTKAKIEKFNLAAADILDGEKQNTIREVASLIGLMVDYSKGIDYGEAHYRRLERHKTLALALNHGKFDKFMTLTEEAIEDIHWWLSHVNTGCRKIRLGKPVITVITDSSDNGWGAVCGKQRTRGLWSIPERAHTNINETKAVLLGLQVYASHYRHCKIRVLSDNTTAVSYVNHKGGSKCDPADLLAKQVWEFCEARDLWVSAAHIPGVENVEADAESRAEGHLEWALPDEVFNYICQFMGQPSVDLFASRLTNKLETYYSWLPDPGATACDALSLPWPNDYYAFPPFSLILKTVQKALAEKVEGILVTQRWAAQPWFGLLMRTSKRQLRLPSVKLRNPVSGETWPLNLVVWKI